MYAELSHNPIPESLVLTTSLSLILIILVHTYAQSYLYMYPNRTRVPLLGPLVVLGNRGV